MCYRVSKQYLNPCENNPVSPPRSFLQKIGVDKSTAYVLGIFLSGGGYIEKNHTDSVAALTAQISELTTGLALAQQIEGQQEKHIESLDRDIRALTRSVDRSSLGKAPVAPRAFEPAALVGDP